MIVEADSSPVPLPDGLYYSRRKGIVVEGVVARQLADHPLGPRPGRGYDSCALNDLAGNSTLSMFLGRIEPGGTKCGHRHFDETLMLFLTGSGHSELRQDDGRPMTRVPWRAGDLLVIPTNAWHQHFNAGSAPPVRYLSFKTARVVQRLVGDPAALAAVRLRERYDDEPDYFTRRGTGADGTVVVNFAAGIADDPLPAADPLLGEGVAIRAYDMGGQRTVGVSLVGVAAGGRVAAHRPVAEEAFVVLRGQGESTLRDSGGKARTVSWSAGDLVSCPLYVEREHRNTGGTEARLLLVRSLFVQAGLGAEPAGLAAGLPDRFPAVVDAAVDLGPVTPGSGTA